MLFLNPLNLKFSSSHQCQFTAAWFIDACKRKKALFLRVANLCSKRVGGNCDEDFCILNSLIHWAQERARGRRKLNYRGCLFCFVLFPFLCPLPERIITGLVCYTTTWTEHQLKLSLRIWWWTILFWFEFRFLYGFPEQLPLKSH